MHTKNFIRIRQIHKSVVSSGVAWLSSTCGAVGQCVQLKRLLVPAHQDCYTMDLWFYTFPCTAGMYRRPYSEVLDEKLVPRIPVQPVSYGDAVHFMRLTSCSEISTLSSLVQVYVRITCIVFSSGLTVLYV